MSESTELAVREPAAVGLFNTDDPDITMARSVKVADLLKDVIHKKELVLKISGREYIKVEGWTTLGALVGLFAQTEWTRPLGDGEGWEASVIVTNGQGAVFGRAEAQCLRSERNWRNRDDFALRSMAQTRAMGKALRMPLGFIAVLAGYEATPAEEMPAPREEEVPFEDGPAQGPGAPVQGPSAPGTGGAGNYADERQVTVLLELAARISEDAHEKAVAALAKHRESHDGRVDWLWLEAQIKKASAKLPAGEAEQESKFVAPESAR